jgi:hypothetical protein
MGIDLFGSGRNINRDWGLMEQVRSGINPNWGGGERMAKIDKTDVLGQTTEGKSDKVTKGVRLDKEKWDLIGQWADDWGVSTHQAAVYLMELGIDQVEKGKVKTETVERPQGL